MFIKQAIYRQTAIPVIEKSLDASVLRGKTIANNMANLTTPGYQRIEVNFEAQLRKVLDKNLVRGTRTDPAHLPVGRPEITEIAPFGYRSKDPTLAGEINNVDIDIEAAKMAENQILYSDGVKFMQQNTAALISAIKGKSK